MSDDILDDFSEENEVRQLHPLFRVYLVVFPMKIVLPIVLMPITGISSFFIKGILEILFGLFVFYLFASKTFHQKEDSNKVLYLLYFLFFVGTLANVLDRWFFDTNYYSYLLLNIFGSIIAWIGAIMLPLHYRARVYGKKSIFGFLQYPVWLTAPFYLTGMVFKTQSWPYASELLTIGTMVFLLSATIAFILHQLKHKRENLWINLISFLAAILCLTGTLFKIQMWPFATEILFTGIGLFLLRTTVLFKGGEQ